MGWLLAIALRLRYRIKKMNHDLRVRAYRRLYEYLGVDYGWDT